MLEYYELALESDPPLLRAARRRPLSPAEITESCELLLLTAQENQCNHWLLDGREHFTANPSCLQTWLQEEYFPRVHRELGSVVYVAFLVAPSPHASAAAAGFESLTSQTSGVRTAAFTDEAAARDWLRQQWQQRGSLPASGRSTLLPALAALALAS
ncbi:hypothetical protein [Solirubrum puertoriconensis]|uniref:Uncharacterized protein n=1 Tax=Solirubrum puertoriconensis TaxID=1751427 RepID=A0A9X0HN20_SOLP1|nr:hypothetical protein [Solirubrum puertoriconensis]KUG09055.1 hypothetical protein ASU33_19735 [Solirubrum puertoriconensis]